MRSEIAHRHNAARQSSPKQLFSILVIVALFGCLLWYKSGRSGPRESLSQIESDVPAILEIEKGEASAVLNFTDETQYLLIVGSLAEGAETFELELSSEPSESEGDTGVTRLPGLTPRPRPPVDLVVAEAAPAPALTDATPRTMPHVVARPILEVASEPSQQPMATAMPSVRGVSATPPDPESRSFFLHVHEGALNDPRQYVEVVANVLREGKLVRVYLDRQMSKRHLAPQLAEEIIRVLESQVIPRARGVLGQFRDVDGDGKLAVLLTPWLARLEGGKTSVGGFVRGGDFQLDRSAPFSNHCDMLYLNTNLRPGPHLETLLAHEYVHVVAVGMRGMRTTHVSGTAADSDEEDWMHEGLAHLCETPLGGNWSNLDYRVSRFLNGTHLAPLAVPDYHRAGLWRDHACRGATFLFLKWCEETFGEDLPARLVLSGATGRRNLEQACGLEFDELFRRWTIAVWQAGRAAPGELSEGGGQSGTDGFRSLDLAGRLGNWHLAGPRVISWHACQKPELTLQVRGTSAAYLRVTGEPGHCVRRIRIRGKQAARMQVTVIPLRNEPPRVAVSAVWAEQGGMTNAVDLATSWSPSRFSGSVLNVNVWLPASPRRGMTDEWRLVALAMESHDGDDRTTEVRDSADLMKLGRALESDSLEREGIQYPIPVSERLLGMAAKAEGASKERPAVRFAGASAQIESRLAAEQEKRATFLLKGVFEDTRGRRQSVWLDIPLPTVRSSPHPALSER